MLTCPHCSHRSTEIMPTDACQFFYDCKGCGIGLKPNTAIAARLLRLGFRAVFADPVGKLLLLTQKPVVSLPIQNQP